MGSPCWVPKLLQFVWTNYSCIMFWYNISSLMLRLMPIQCYFLLYVTTLSVSAYSNCTAMSGCLSPSLCCPQWSSFALNVRTRTFSEGRELIRHQDISVPLIPCPSLTIYTLRRVLLLQWNHTNTSSAQWCGQSLSVSMWVFYDVCSVLCVCISQPRGYLERSLGFFCSV